MRKNLIIIAITLLIYCIWKYSIIMPVQKTTKDYIGSIISGNMMQAQGLSTSRAAFRASKIKDTYEPAKIYKISTIVQSYSSKWAKVIVRVVIKQNGQYDVGWYSLYLNKNIKWQVKDFYSTEPCLSGINLPGSSTRQVDVFKAYVEAIERSKWDEAIKYLAGPAKVAQEKSQIKYPVSVNISKLKHKMLWNTNQISIVQFQYGKNQVDVTFYKTPAGWKIINIQ